MNIIRKSNLLGSEVTYTSHIPQEGMNEWKRRTISTGSQNLDSLLGGGGVRIGEVTEFHGASFVGKTELCHRLSVFASRYATGGKTIFMDTEGGFSSERVGEIAEKIRYNPDLASRNTIDVKVYSCKEQEDYLGKIEEQLSNHVNSVKSYKLIIIDSVIANYKAEFIGRENLCKRQQRLYAFMRKLSRVATTYNIAVVITNHINEVPDANEFSQIKPAGGNAIGYNTTHRISMKLRPGRCVASVYSSKYLSDNNWTCYTI